MPAMNRASGRCWAANESRSIGVLESWKVERLDVKRVWSECPYGDLSVRVRHPHNSRRLVTRAFRSSPELQTSRADSRRNAPSWLVGLGLSCFRQRVPHRLPRGKAANHPCGTRRSWRVATSTHLL